MSHQALVKWLEERDNDAPFFAYVNYLEAHHPRIPSLASRQALLDALPDESLRLLVDLLGTCLLAKI